MKGGRYDFRLFANDSISLPALRLPTPVVHDFVQPDDSHSRRIVQYFSCLAIFRNFGISTATLCRALKLKQRNTGTGLGGHFHLHDHHDAVPILHNSIHAIQWFTKWAAKSCQNLQTYPVCSWAHRIARLSRSFELFQITRSHAKY